MIRSVIEGLAFNSRWMLESIEKKVGCSGPVRFVGGGVAGALVLPLLSDRFMKRKLFLVINMAGMVPALAGLAFADRLSGSPETVYTIALVSASLLGFFVMSAGPIGFQYAAEITWPLPESGSQGLLLAGQISGIAFTALMSIGANRLLKTMMVVFAVLSVVSFLLVLALKESPLIGVEKE
jgi:hypothetical protein